MKKLTQNERNYNTIKRTKNILNLNQIKSPILGNTYKNIISQKKKQNAHIPVTNIIKKKKPNYFLLKNQNKIDYIKRKSITKKQPNNFIKRNKTNNNFSSLEDNILPKLKIRVHSMKHNLYRNTISFNENDIKFNSNILKVKEQISEPKRDAILNESNHIYNQWKNNFSSVSLGQDNFNLRKMKIIPENRDLSSLNIYSVLKEKSLKVLSHHLDDLIVNRIKQKSEHPSNNTINQTNYSCNTSCKNINNGINLNCINNYNNKCNTNVYRKKIQKKINNFAKLSSEDNYLTLNFKYNSNESNKNLKNPDTFDLQNYSILPTNNLESNRTYKISSTRNTFQNQNLHEYFSKNSDFGSLMLSQNNSILLTSFELRKNLEQLNQNYLKMEKPKKEQINIENNNNLIINHKANTINFIEIVKPEYKGTESISLNKDLCFGLKNKNNYNYNFKTFKTNNVLTDPKEGGNEIHTKYGNMKNLNNIIKQDNKNKTKKYFTIYSKALNKNKYASIMNNSYKNILSNHQKKKELNIKPNKNSLNNNSIKFGKHSFQIYNKNKKLIITCGSSKNKKLKNVITSIEINQRNPKNIPDKNIILSEVDQNGKINNIKIRQMKNSIEKVLKETFLDKKKIISPQKWNDSITYVKKNQGTHLKKMKKYNTTNNIDYHQSSSHIQ